MGLIPREEAAASPEAGTPSPRGVRRRNELLLIAVEQLRDAGTAGFSLRQVAKRARTNHRMLSYYFESNSQLLREATREIRRQAFERQQLPESPEASLDMLAGLAGDADSRLLLETMLLAAIEPDVYGDLGRDYIEAYLPVIDTYIPEDVKGDARADLATLFLYTYRGALIDARTTGDTERGDRAVRLLLDLTQQLRN